MCTSIYVYTVFLKKNLDLCNCCAKNVQLIVAKLASTQVTYNDVFHVNPVSNNRQETPAAPISFRLSKPALLTSIIEVCKKGAQTVE
jgi:hypothetical protein